MKEAWVLRWCVLQRLRARCSSRGLGVRLGAADGWGARRLRELGGVHVRERVRGAEQKQDVGNGVEEVADGRSLRASRARTSTVPAPGTIRPSLITPSSTARSSSRFTVAAQHDHRGAHPVALALRVESLIAIDELAARCRPHCDRLEDVDAST